MAVLGIDIGGTKIAGGVVEQGGRVMTSYPGYQGTAMAIAPNDTDCVSNGVIEQQLATALR